MVRCRGWPPRTSLGAVLAFAATGKGPFGSGSTPALVYRVVYQPASLDNVPDEVRALIERCLAKDPGERPTARDVLADASVAQPAGNWLPDPVNGPRRLLRAHPRRRPCPRPPHRRPECLRPPPLCDHVPDRITDPEREPVGSRITDLEHHLVAGYVTDHEPDRAGSRITDPGRHFVGSTLRLADLVARAAPPGLRPRVQSR